MRIFKLIITLILVTSSLFSQVKKDRFSNIQTDFFIGKNIEHDKILKDAIDGTAYGVLISWNTVSSENSKFNKLYNFPERGFSFIYQNLNSSVLGEVYGAYRHFTYNLTPSKKNQLALTTGFGIGYANKKYHAVTNPKNHAISSELLVTAYLRLQYFKILNKQNISINSSIGLLHFSNTAFKNPNLGINTLTLNLGVNYKLRPIDFQEQDDSFEKIDSKINYNLILRAGYNESKEIGSGLFPFYTVSAYGEKKLNHYSTVTAGIDFYNSKFLKKYIETQNTKNGTNFDETNIFRGGIFIGHELAQNHFTFISQLGYTFYSPYVYISRIYERFGIKYKLSRHLFAEATLKVNLFRAEAFELGIGYKF